MTTYDVYEYDGHMLLKIKKSIPEEDALMFGPKHDTIYGDYGAKTPTGWIVVEDGESRYYIIRAK